jgi:hypothetical protein
MPIMNNNKAIMNVMTGRVDRTEEKKAWGRCEVLIFPAKQRVMHFHSMFYAS